MCYIISTVKNNTKTFKEMFTMTITKTILDKKLENLNRQFNTNLFVLNYAYGGVRLCKTFNENGGLTEISERVSKSEMARIIDAISNTFYKFNIKVD